VPDAGDEGAGGGHRLRGLIDEPFLHLTPFTGETEAGGFRQRLDRELRPVSLVSGTNRLYPSAGSETTARHAGAPQSEA
jgi:hypothetical protein